jgi:zinc-ribbon domain
MFCNRCGAQLQEGSNACPACGKQIGDPVALTAQTRLQRHLRPLGIFWIILGVFFVLKACAVLIMKSALPFFIPGSDRMFHVFGPMVLTVIGSVLLLIGAGGVLTGWGLMQHQPWARLVALILGILALFHPLLGTGLGIYTLWVLLADEGGAEYDRIARAV